MRTPRKPALATALTTLALRAGDAGAQPAGYARAFEESARLEREGRPRAAAEALAAAADAFPQDYAAALRLAWLRFLAGDYAAARARYQHALELSAGASLEARLGLAWTLRAQGEGARSRAEFERVLALAPDSASAREGLSLVRLEAPRAARVWPSFTVGGQLYANHPLLRSGWSVNPAATAVLGDAFLVSLSYRLLRYEAGSNASASVTAGTQQDLFASIGLVRPTFSLQLHAGYVWDPDNPALPAYVLGASGAFDLAGTLRLEGSGTWFSDGVTGRAALSWGFRLTDWLSLGPSASAQLGPSGFGGSLGALALARRGRFSLALAGRYGDERRPTFLNDSLAYATNYSIRGSASARARVELGAGLALTLGYEWQRLATSAPGGSSPDADAHYFSAGVAGAF